MRLRAGDRLGPYEIEAVIGVGGMGEVYRAIDRRLNRQIAVKVLLPEIAADLGRRERFQREARAIAALNHPHICTLHDVGQHDGLDFLVMECVDGETLAARLTRGRLPIEQVLRYAIQVADALDAAHRREIVHRDLKPANIMLDKQGVKLLDFGIAKLRPAWRETADAVSTRTRTAARTAEGTIVGTPQYMAPEQIEGREADARADIFAFGAVVYEMASGKRAFEGTSQAGVIAAILDHVPAPIAATEPLTPPLLDHVVRTCLAKDRDQRWQAIADVGHQLRWIAEVHAGRSARPRSPRRANASIALACLAAAAATTAVIWPLARRGQPPRAITRTEVSVAPADVLRANADDSVIEGGQPSRTSLALSPDGQTVVFSAMAGNRQQLYVRNLDRLEATPIAGTEDGSNPFLSPDGRWVGFWAKGALRKIPLAGDGPPTLICETAPVFGASWSSNDTIVYAIQVGGLWQVAAGGGTPRPLTTLDAKKGDYSHRLPHFLPDGKAVVFTITQHFLPRWDDARLALLTLATGERDDLGPGADARYVPSGHLVFVRSGTLVAAPFQGSTRKIVGSSVSIVGDVMQAANMVSIAQDTGAGQFSVSASGSLMYVRGGISPDGESRVMSVDRRGRVQELPTSAHFYFAPMLSPDATRLILWTRGVDRNVWTYEIAGGTLARLTTEGRNSRAIWTPDGKRVTYTGAVTGADNLFWAPADRSGAPERLTTSANGQDPSSWSPDGATLAFLERVGPDNHDVLTIAPDSDRRPRPILQSHFDETYAEFSPNGHWLAYVSNESGRNEVYVQAYPKPGARHQISTEGGVQPAWSRDGRELFYTTPAPGRGVRFMSVPIAVTPSFTAEAPRMLFEGRYVVQGATRGYDVSADGQRFYVTQARDRPPIRPTQMILVQNWIDELKRRVPTR